MQYVPSFQGAPTSAMNFPTEAYLTAVNRVGQTALAGQQAAMEGINKGVGAVVDAYKENKKMESDVKSSTAVAQGVLDMMEPGKAKDSLQASIEAIKSDPSLSLRDKYERAQQFKQFIGATYSNMVDFENKKKLEAQHLNSMLQIERERSRAQIEGDVLKGVLSGSAGGGRIPPSVEAILSPLGLNVVKEQRQIQSDQLATQQQILSKQESQALINHEKALIGLAGVKQNPNATAHDIFLAQQNETAARAATLVPRAAAASFYQPKETRDINIQSAEKNAAAVLAQNKATFEDTAAGKKLLEQDAKFGQQYNAIQRLGSMIDRMQELYNSNPSGQASDLMKAAVVKEINSLVSAEAVQQADLARYPGLLSGLEAGMKSAFVQALSAPGDASVFEKFAAAMTESNMERLLNTSKNVFDVYAPAVNRQIEANKKIGGDWYTTNIGAGYNLLKSYSKESQAASDEALGQVRKTSTSGLLNELPAPTAISSQVKSAAEANATPVLGNTRIRVNGKNLGQSPNKPFVPYTPEFGSNF